MTDASVGHFYFFTKKIPKQPKNKRTKPRKSEIYQSAIVRTTNRENKEILKKTLKKS